MAHPKRVLLALYAHCGALQVKDMESSTPGINESLRNAKLLLKKSKRVDYYKLLEISQDANDYDIKKVGCHH